MVTVKDRLYLNDAIMMYKCINKLAPDYLADKFVQRSHIHNRGMVENRISGRYQTSSLYRNRAIFQTLTITVA